MESDDEFNQFVTNEVVDLSSSDDEDDLFFGLRKRSLRIR
jgi:hypothetical protein